MTVAIIGIGNMGQAIAQRLIDLGHTPVLWNRTRSKATAISVASVAPSPVAAAQSAEVILSILANDTAIEAAYFGPDGLCSADLSGKVVVEMCTTSPAQTLALEAAVQAQGGLFLECPVGGTIGPARAGQLLGLAGGSDPAFKAAKSVLTQITRRLEHLGPVGTGAAMKLAINLPLMVYWGAVGEALGLALGQGIDADLAASLLIDSSGAIGAAKNRVPPIAAMLKTGEPGGVALSLDNGIKDMGLMQELAGQHAIPSEVISAALAKATKAAAAGWGDQDASLYGIFGQGPSA
ncbi:MAG: NAD-binding protein [Rhodobacteraceae bacterium]|nr:NAD-binding protein [Paracoccaceae bacterium]